MSGFFHLWKEALRESIIFVDINIRAPRVCGRPDIGPFANHTSLAACKKQPSQLFDWRFTLFFLNFHLQYLSHMNTVAYEHSEQGQITIHFNAGTGT
jgi:hypothetical protein